MKHPSVFHSITLKMLYKVNDWSCLGYSSRDRHDKPRLCSIVAGPIKQFISTVFSCPVPLHYIAFFLVTKLNAGVIWKMDVFREISNLQRMGPTFHKRGRQKLDVNNL